MSQPHLYGGQAPAYIHPAWYPRDKKAHQDNKPLPKTPDTSRKLKKAAENEADRRREQPLVREKERGRENKAYPFPEKVTPHESYNPTTPPSPRKVLFESDFMRHSVSIHYPTLHPVLALDTSRIKLDVRVNPHRGSERIAAQRFWDAKAILSRPTVHMRLISPDFPWTFELDYRSLLTQSITHHVTCGDIWSAITAGLAHPITDSEWNMLVCSRRSDKMKRRMLIEAIVAQRTEEQGKYARRADWLGRNVVFRGLEKNDQYARDVRLPGRDACVETWVMRFVELKM